MHPKKRSYFRRDRLRKRKKRLATLVVFVFLAFSTSMLFNSGGASDVPDYLEFAVQPGDTLWKIARMHLPDGMDIREFIFEIKKANDISTSIIHPGDVLLLPL